MNVWRVRLSCPVKEKLFTHFAVYNAPEQYTCGGAKEIMFAPVEKRVRVNATIINRDAVDALVSVVVLRGDGTSGLVAPSVVSLLGVGDSAPSIFL